MAWTFDEARILTEPVFGRRRLDPEYCRKKAAFCRELAQKPAHKTQAKILLKMAARFERQANGDED